MSLSSLSRFVCATICCLVMMLNVSLYCMLGMYLFILTASFSIESLCSYAAYFSFWQGVIINFVQILICCFLSVGCKSFSHLRGEGVGGGGGVERRGGSSSLTLTTVVPVIFAHSTTKPPGVYMDRDMCYVAMSARIRLHLCTHANFFVHRSQVIVSSQLPKHYQVKMTAAFPSAVHETPPLNLWFSSALAQPCSSRPYCNIVQVHVFNDLPISSLSALLHFHVRGNAIFFEHEYPKEKTKPTRLA